MHQKAAQLTFDVRELSVGTSGAERQRCTATLCITADGRKLPPYIVLRRKTLLKEKFPQGIIVHVQDKGWVFDNLLTQ